MTEMAPGVLLWSEYRDAIGPGACPDIAIPVFHGAEHIVAANAAEVAFLMTVVPEPASDRVEVIEPTAIRADPKFFIGCFGDAEHIIVAEGIIVQGMPVMNKLAGISFMDIQTAGECAYPHIADVVHIGSMDGVVTEAGGVDVIMHILPECVGIGIVDINTGIFQCYPQAVVGIFTYSKQRVA